MPMSLLMSNISSPAKTSNNFLERMFILWGLTMGMAVTMSFVAAFTFYFTANTWAVLAGCVLTAGLTIPFGISVCGIGSVIEHETGLGGLVGFFMASFLAGMCIPLLTLATLVLGAIALLLRKKKPQMFNFGKFILASGS